MRRRPLLHLLVLGLSLTLVAAACGGDENDAAEEEDTGEQAEEVDPFAGLSGDPVKLMVIIEETGTVLANPEIPEGAQAAALAASKGGGADARTPETSAC